MTNQVNEGVAGPDLAIEDYLDRIIQNLSRQGALLEARCEALEAGDFDGSVNLAELRALTLAVQGFLKEEGRLRDELRKRRDADGGAGIDLDAARGEIERRMALLRERSSADRIAAELEAG